MDASPLRRLLQGIVALTAILSTACGGGGGSSTPTTPAPSGLKYSAPPAFTVQQAISPLTPTVNGTVTSYTVSPALPSGLVLNASTGAISGTPTAIAATSAYVVTATNVGGGTTASVSITVNDVPPALTYPSPSYTFTANVVARTIIPRLSGGAVTGWNISPALPAGLAFDSTTGNISGTPTTVSASTSYVVTATNSGGPTTETLNIAVAAGPLLDLGHATSIILMRATSSVVLSLDSSGHWILQNYASGTTLVRGDGACGTGNTCPFPNPGSLRPQPPPTYPPVDLAGSVMIDTASAGMEVRSATDGHVLTTLPGQFTWYRLASDGSYVCAGSTTLLTAWNASGQTLFTQSGNYSTANVFAAPGQVLVALGPAGQNVIETITTSGTSSQSSIFSGQFSSWFLDGSRFLTTLGTAVWTYSNTAVQQDLTQIESNSDIVIGQGNWLWTAGTGPLKIYKVGSSAIPTLSTGALSQVLPTGNVIALMSGNQLEIVDLSGATPVIANYSVPVASAVQYVGIPGGAWVVGSSHGVLFDGATLNMNQPRYLSTGTAYSIAGGTSYFSIATAAGTIYSYSSTTNTLVNTTNFASALLSASSSGAVLAAMGDFLDYYTIAKTINVYSLPAGTVENTLTYSTFGTPVMSLSGSGSVLQAPVANTSGCGAEAIDLTGGGVLWCGTDSSSAFGPVYSNVALSPDGTLVSAALGGAPWYSLAATTNIYKNGALSGALAAQSVGWLDNGRLLANTFTGPGSNGKYNYSGSVIYDPTGNVLSNPPLKTEIDAFNVVASNTIYSPGANANYSLASGTVTWASADSTTGVGAVAGSQIVFASGTLILAQPYTGAQ